MHRTHPVSPRAVPVLAHAQGLRQLQQTARVFVPGPLRPAHPAHAAQITRLLTALLALVAALAAACTGNHRPLTSIPTPSSTPGSVERGMASWYGPKFNGHRTASGERYDKRALTAAHPTLPFGTLVRVTNVENGRQAVVRINDRGPFSKKRVIDLSYTAARELGVVGPGTAEVELAVLPPDGAIPEPATLRNPVVVAALRQGMAGSATVPAVLGAAPASAVLSAVVEPLRFTVQVGAFSDRERADAMQQDLARTYPQTNVSSDGTWSRVQLGSFDSREQAEMLCLELSSQGVPAIVVTLQ